ncbi:MAG: nucleoside deaminase [Caldisericia bacterium]
MDEFMKLAIEEAKKGLKEGGIPIGSLLVSKDGKVLGKGHNRRVQDDDPLAHAEIVAIRKAGRIKSYKDVVLYSTLMPCYLCAGAIVQFGIKKVVVGESKNFSGAKEFLLSHGVEVIDLNDPECIKLMRKFIEDQPNIWYEDIGKL